MGSSKVGPLCANAGPRRPRLIKNTTHRLACLSERTEKWRPPPPRGPGPWALFCHFSEATTASATVGRGARLPTREPTAASSSKGLFFPLGLYICTWTFLKNNQRGKAAAMRLSSKPHHLELIRERCAAPASQRNQVIDSCRVTLRSGAGR